MRVLLTYEPHVDLANRRGETVLPHLPPSTCLVNLVSLRCLTAKAILRHGVHYHGVLPPSVTKFVDMH
jgi:hypothetical protein